MMGHPFLFIFVGFCIWSFNLYYTFYTQQTSTVMIAFIGHGHVRSFERQFQSTGHDLWAFGHMKRKISAVHIEPRGNAWQVFKDHSHYKHVLFVDIVRHIPAMFDSNCPIFYFHEGKQVASLWPRLQLLPETHVNFTQFIQKHSIEIEKIYI